MIQRKVNPNAAMNTRASWSLPDQQSQKTKPHYGSLKDQKTMDLSSGPNSLETLRPNNHVHSNNNNCNSNNISPSSSPKVISHKWLRKHLTLLPSIDDGRLKMETTGPLPLTFDPNFQSIAVTKNVNTIKFVKSEDEVNADGGSALPPLTKHLPLSTSSSPSPTSALSPSQSPSPSTTPSRFTSAFNSPVHTRPSTPKQQPHTHDHNLGIDMVGDDELSPCSSAEVASSPTSITATTMSPSNAPRSPVSFSKMLQKMNTTSILTSASAQKYGTEAGYVDPGATIQNMKKEGHNTMHLNHKLHKKKGCYV